MPSCPVASERSSPRARHSVRALKEKKTDLSAPCCRARSRLSRRASTPSVFSARRSVLPPVAHYAQHPASVQHERHHALVARFQLIPLKQLPRDHAAGVVPCGQRHLKSHPHLRLLLLPEACQHDDVLLVTRRVGMHRMVPKDVQSFCFWVRVLVEWVRSSAAARGLRLRSRCLRVSWSCEDR